MHHDSLRNASSKNEGFYGDQAWAHWDYSPEEWAAFDRVDWQAVRLRYWLPNLIPLVGIFILGIVSSPANLLGVVLGTIAFGLPFSAALFLVRGYSYREAKARHRARQSREHPQRVTFSGKGVWEAGTYFPLMEVFLALHDVRMTSQPAVLHFRRKRLISRNTRVRDTLRVLVPRGHEEEAAQLMERFRMEISEAKKRATGTPPEPV